MESVPAQCRPTPGYAAVQNTRPPRLERLTTRHGRVRAMTAWRRSEQRASNAWASMRLHAGAPSLGCGRRRPRVRGRNAPPVDLSAATPTTATSRSPAAPVSARSSIADRAQSALHIGSALAGRLVGGGASPASPRPVGAVLTPFFSNGAPRHRYDGESFTSTIARRDRRRQHAESDRRGLLRRQCVCPARRQRGRFATRGRHAGRAERTFS